ncbi:MAG TPA: ribose 5-phosphate isomerase B [Alphaproteobacteria bacterium]|nr:ribose 5-phosphate isomerase B [Alphaproteobacteria bacterium]
MAEVIALAADHGGFELKNLLAEKLAEWGYEPLDLGTYSTDSVDYPDMAAKMADAIKAGKAERGVLVCGTGIGISIAANRFPFIRAALIHDAFGARLCREHNNANVIVFGGRTTGVEVAYDCLNIFLNTQFAGGRHARRVEKLSHLV